jgi:hypothetical protein
MSKYILISLTGIGLLIQVCASLAARRISVRFCSALKTFVDFLLAFEETPRSKFAKKYIPPMDVLQEESSSMYAETIRTVSTRHNIKMGGLSATISIRGGEFQSSVVDS